MIHKCIHHKVYRNSLIINKTELRWTIRIASIQTQVCNRKKFDYYAEFNEAGKLIKLHTKSVADFGCPWVELEILELIKNEVEWELSFMLIIAIAISSEDQNRNGL